ncbi:MAG: DUF1588 domain-containing protein [Bryobacteraceae bacterium]|nr:DUF1588 domain-containing protein [Bryobacteraceae bacterium]
MLTALFAMSLLAAEAPFTEGQAFLQQYCAKCHQTAVGGFALKQVADPGSLRGNSRQWSALANRVRNGEMPPKGSPAPPLDARERFTTWVDEALHTEVCGTGPVQPSRAPIRRLNRDEYTATLRDLLDMHMDIGASLPVDGAGGEGFDNAAETLFLSPLHAEKYMAAAKFAMDFAGREFKSRYKILVAKPGPGVSPQQAARKIFANFLPRAFRRPVGEADLTPYLALFDSAMRQGQPFEPAIFFSLRGALVSPLFLFRTEPQNPLPTPRLVDQYSMASRLSYFLWGTAPDDLLTDLAAAGKLQDPAVLKPLIGLMLRNDRSLEFARRFTEQWLHTRDLMGDKAPDAKLFAAYAGDEDVRSDVRLQPVLFLRELLARDLSLLNLIDSTHTISTRHLNKLYNVNMPLNQNANTQPQWVAVPEGSRRGGLLGMGAVLTVSSYPYRTSPVLRGAWILDSLLGTPPPPPPPDVPALETDQPGAPPKTMRARLTQHRANTVCASCHSRIDPLGFALENYDVLGRWRDEEAGQPVDNSGELADGTKIAGPDALRKVLLERKDLVIRNLANRMLGYALGRGLTLADSCAVDQIVAYTRQNDYRAQALIEAIVTSVPFRFQAGQPPVKGTKP